MEHKEDLHPNDDPWAANMRLHGKTSLIGIIRSERRDYEAQRTKDRALIQALVNALDKCTIDKPDIDGTEFQATALSTAKEQGFTPTEE
jgi:hypothetical protein